MKLSNKKEKVLEELRRQIDQTDRRIVEAILERAKLVKEIGRAKEDAGTAVYRPDREKQVYQNIRRYVEELSEDAPVMPASVLEHVYREIMSGSIALEGGPRVAYLGPEASFSHQATRARFGASLGFTPVRSISEVFRAVESGQEAQFGVVPVENTIAGTVGLTLDRFLQTDLQVYAEHYIQIRMSLLGPEGTDLRSIKKLYSFKIVLEQCREWLASHLNMSGIQIVETGSTADAARLVAENRDGVAIASDFAAETYGLGVLASDIQDKSYNITRFFVIGREQCPPTGDDKTSIVCTALDSPGSLYTILQIFEKARINLTRIESRATRQSFGDYNFFIDFLGHRQDPQVEKVLNKIAGASSHLGVLGSYPRMDPPE